MAEWATMSPEDEAREEADMSATSCIPYRRIKTCLAHPLSRANAADRVRSAALMVLEPKQAPIPAMQLSYSYDVLVYTSDQPISKGKRECWNYILDRGLRRAILACIENTY